MEIWAPVNNRVKIEEVQASNLWDWTYWDTYFAEPDLVVREELLANFDSPNFKL